MYNPRSNPDGRWKRRTGVLAVAFTMLASAALALPEDAAQPIYADAETFTGSLDDGLVVYYGSAEKPVRITQGSMVISGLEVRVESPNGTLEKVTATGNPARFQQQPAADKELVHVTALTLVFDNAAQLLIADKEAALVQAGNTINAEHIEYDMRTRSFKATGGAGQAQMQILPPADAGN